ncbi:MAG: inorganic phosphate transporter, partial [Clostridiales bacterium]|jgi:PiT family inorganic phosphate transporter|nr:inorganic phosphate transporter [Clostridiales bacterium]
VGFFVVLIIIVTLGYTVFVGYNDGANAIATGIATRAMSHKTAVVITVISTVAAPILYTYFGAELSVANTIGKTVEHGALFDSNTYLAYSFVFAGVLGGLVWCLFSAKNRLPVSTSHSLLGGISGAGVAAFGFLPVDWNSLFIKIILTSVLVPLVSFLVSYIIMKIIRKIAYNVPVSSSGIIKRLQILNVAVLSSAISINNVQKPLGVLFLTFAATGFAYTNNTILLIVALSALALTLGACFGGTRIIHTVGRKIFKIQPIHSFLAQISVEFVIFAASGFGIPVSAGQAVSSTVMGVGASDRFGQVNWSNSLRIFIFWVLTYPVTFVLGGALTLIFKIFFH